MRDRHDASVRGSGKYRRLHLARIWVTQPEVADKGDEALHQSAVVAESMLHILAEMAIAGRGGPDRRKHHALFDIIIFG